MHICMYIGADLTIKKWALIYCSFSQEFRVLYNDNTENSCTTSPQHTHIYTHKPTLT